MAYPLEGPMPLIDLVAGCTLTLEAVDPTTGASVAGVTFSDGVAYVDAQEPSGGEDVGTLRVWLQPPSAAA